MTYDASPKQWNESSHAKRGDRITIAGTTWEYAGVGWWTSELGDVEKSGSGWWFIQAFARGRFMGPYDTVREAMRAVGEPSTDTKGGEAE